MKNNKLIRQKEYVRKMVHTFKCLDKNYMLDVESGSLFQIDDLIMKIVEKEISPTKNVGDFSSYTLQQIDEAVMEIKQLKLENSLFVKSVLKRPPDFNGDIKSMCLNISHKCNLACSYCFADGGSYNLEKENMSLDVATKAIDFLIAHSGKKYNLEVDFFGGEPLLNIDVVKKTVAYARSKEKECNKKFRFTITTNCMTLNDDISDFFNREMHNVVLSIDGRKDVHNSVRKTANGKDSYDIAVKNALAFRKKRGNKMYFVRGTFTQNNKDFLNDILALNDLGFDQISIEPVVLPDNHPLALRKEDVAQLVVEYEKLAAEYIERRKGEKWFSFFHFVIDLKNGPCERKRLASCGAGREYVAVVPSGDIYPCHQFAGTKEFLLGNVFNEIENVPVVSYFSNNNVADKPECRDCWAKYYCSGGCAANAYNFNHSITKPYKLACELMQKRIECALAVYSVEHSELK